MKIIHSITGIALFVSFSVVACEKNKPDLSIETHKNFVFNRAPRVLDFKFSDSNFTCGTATEVCILAEDPDGDPLDIRLDIDAKLGCQLSPLETHKPNGYFCHRLQCKRSGRAELKLSVFDLATKRQVRANSRSCEGIFCDDKHPLTMEKWLFLRGQNAQSRTEFSFSAYFDQPSLDCFRDSDGDGFGTGFAMHLCSESCPGGTVTNNLDPDDQDALVRPALSADCDASNPAKDTLVWSPDFHCEASSPLLAIHHADS